jgi:hypothetical protein
MFKIESAFNEMPQFGEIVPPGRVQIGRSNAYLGLDRAIGRSGRLP